MKEPQKLQQASVILPDITKQMPFSNDAEKGVLSCFFHNPTDLLTDARNTIPVEAFYHPANRLLYETMLLRHEDEMPIEYIAISQYLTDKGLFDKMGGQGTLAELLDFVPTPTHYGYYKGILLDKYLLRRIIGSSTESIENAYEFQEDVPGLLERVTDRFILLTKQQQGKAHRTWRDILAEYTNTWEARVRGEIETGIPTRWPSFNRTFVGITPRLWLIAGYPSDGKSTLLQNLEEDALAQGRHVLKFSFEMDETELADRLMTAKTQLDSQRIFFPQNGVDMDDIHKINKATTEMEEWGLHLRCEDWTFEQVMAECRAMVMKDPKIGLISIDYLQLLVSSKKFDTRSAELTYMSRSFKRLNRALNLPIIVLSQLNDDGKTLETRAPTQDSSNIVAIENARKELVKGKWIEHKGGLRVVKNRNGKKGHLLPIILKGAVFTFDEEPSEDGPELPAAPPAKGKGWE